MIHPERNEDVLVDMEGRCNPLREYVDDVVVGIGAVVKLSAKRVLPFLRGDLADSVGSMKNKAFELQFTHCWNAGPQLEGQVAVGLVCVGQFHETNLWIEIRAGLSPLRNAFEP